MHEDPRAAPGPSSVDERPSLWFHRGTMSGPALPTRFAHITHSALSPALPYDAFDRRVS